ncbi:hypothetical protein CsSME_00035594 [Camellia sinensis var. sinensis]
MSSGCLQVNEMMCGLFYKRWTIIRKRRSNVNVGGGSQLSEAQLAARRAVSLALNMPMVDSLTAACSNGIGDSIYF